MAADDAVPAASTFEITVRVARYAYDRLTIAGPISAVALGTGTVLSIGALEGTLYLMPEHRSAWLTKTRFVSRYAIYNIVPSLIWGTHAPSAIVASSSHLESTMKPTNTWLYRIGAKDVSAGGVAMPPKRVLWVKILCSLRGAVAGSVVLSNVIALTSLWQRARAEYAERIRRGREPPLVRSNFTQSSPSESLDGCTIRLAGARSDVTELSLHRRGQTRLWPIFEDPDGVQRLVTQYGGQDKDNHLLPQVPVYWQVNDGEYSKQSSWDGMSVPNCWLYSIQGNGRKKKLLYLEADATSGGESALSLQKDLHSHEGVKEQTKWRWGHHRSTLKDKLILNVGAEEEMSTAYFDLDLKEVAQGFRRLTDLAKKRNNGQIEVMRVLLIDPTVVIESGGGRQTTVRDYVEELKLADIIVDARGLVLKSILEWLEKVDTDKGGLGLPGVLGRKPVILETPSKTWFNSIRSELRNHGYDVIDRAEALAESTSQSDTGTNYTPPMLVYERSSADTGNTIRQYVDRGIVKDPSRVCALLTSHEGLNEVESLNKTLPTPVGFICSSDIHDRALEWVRKQSVDGVPADKIQEQLDAAKA